MNAFVPPKQRARLACSIAVTVSLIATGCNQKAPAQQSDVSPKAAATSEQASQPNVFHLHDTNAAPTNGSAPKVSYAMMANPLASSNIVRSFAARGIIRSLPAEGNSVVIRHEEIVGFMPKMTMEFDVRNTNELRGLQAGDTIVFDVKANQNESWIEGIRRAGTNEVVLPAPSDPSSVALLHAGQLKLGEVMPDAELLGENGQKIRLSDFEGKAVAFTFIFTRCPLPDYCPRMNNNFSEAREQLLVAADAPSNWQFISISFDPEFDKPGVLERYAFSYRGNITNQWLFASASTDVLKALAPQIDFRFANEMGSFQHNLRTVVLDPKRRVARQFEGNKWKAADLADSIIQAARQGHN